MKKIIIITPLLVALIFAFYTISSNQKSDVSGVTASSKIKSLPEKITQNLQEMFSGAQDEKYRSGLIVPPKAKTIGDFIEGRTFWNADYNDNRLYFSADQKITVQFFKDKDQFKVGDTISGTWTLKKDRLCFNLQPVIQDEVCYNASVNYTQSGIPGYTDELILVNGLGVQKTYNRQAQGNLILEPRFAKLSAHELQEMERIRSRLLISPASYERHKSRDITTLNATNQKYFNALFNSVMSAPITYMHFNEDGTYASILKGDFEQYQGNQSELKKHVRRGEWWIVRNKYHCYGFDLDEINIQDRFVFCNVILPPSTMAEVLNGFVSHSTHGFTMRHLEKNFIPSGDFNGYEILK